MTRAAIFKPGTPEARRLAAELTARIEELKEDLTSTDLTEPETTGIRYQIQELRDWLDPLIHEA